MRSPKQKQPQVKKGLCQVLEYVDVDLFACLGAFRCRDEFVYGQQGVVHLQYF